MADLKRLSEANRRFELKITVLNAAIVTVLVYVLAMLLGITTYFGFYWEGSILSTIPFWTAVLIGLGAARLIKRRARPDLFDLLGGELSEKARAAYDNRGRESVVMERLAVEVKAALSSLRPSDILDDGRTKRRLAAAAFLVITVVLVDQTQIGAEITPADFGVIGDLGDMAMSLIQEEDPVQKDGESHGGIYGKPSLAVLQETTLEFQVNPGTGAGSITKEAAPVEHLFRTTSPGHGVAVPSDLYIESLPAQHREIIKRYFETLAKG